MATKRGTTVLYFGFKMEGGGDSEMEGILNHCVNCRELCIKSLLNSISLINGIGNINLLLSRKPDQLGREY